MNVKFDDTVYRTHDNWGNENVFLNEEDMNKCIKSLRTLGEDWETVDISDCRVYSFEKKLGGRRAQYVEEYTRNAKPEVFIKNKDGSYSME